MRLQIDEFLELVKTSYGVSPHSYISKAQTKYLEDRKEHLPGVTALA